MRRSLLWLCPTFTPLLMPALSPTMETASLVEWKVKPGSRIEPGCTICTIQTDKAIVGFENQLEEGYFAKALAKEGDVVAVNGIIGVMVEDEADVSKADQYVPPTAKADPPAPKKPEAAAAPAEAPPAKAAPSGTTGGFFGGSVESAVRASGPVVSRIAAAVGAGKLAAVIPTGKNGRFTKGDVLHLDAPASTPVAPLSTTSAAVTPSGKFGVVLKVQPVVDFSVSDRNVLRTLIGQKIAKKATA